MGSGSSSSSSTSREGVSRAHDPRQDRNPTVGQRQTRYGDFGNDHDLQGAETGACSVFSPVHHLCVINSDDGARRRLLGRGCFFCRFVAPPELQEKGASHYDLDQHGNSSDSSSSSSSIASGDDDEAGDKSGTKRRSRQQKKIKQPNRKQLHPPRQLSVMQRQRFHQEHLAPSKKFRFLSENYYPLLWDIAAMREEEEIQQLLKRNNTHDKSRGKYVRHSRTTSTQHQAVVTIVDESDGNTTKTGIKMDNTNRKEENKKEGIESGDVCRRHEYGDNDNNADCAGGKFEHYRWVALLESTVHGLLRLSLERTQTTLSRVGGLTMGPQLVDPMLLLDNSASSSDSTRVDATTATATNFLPPSQMMTPQNLYVDHYSSLQREARRLQLQFPPVPFIHSHHHHHHHRGSSPLPSRLSHHRMISELRNHHQSSSPSPVGDDAHKRRRGRGGMAVVVEQQQNKERKGKGLLLRDSVQEINEYNRLHYRQFNNKSASSKNYARNGGNHGLIGHASSSADPPAGSNATGGIASDVTIITAAQFISPVGDFVPFDESTATTTELGSNGLKKSSDGKTFEGKAAADDNGSQRVEIEVPNSRQKEPSEPKVKQKKTPTAADSEEQKHYERRKAELNALLLAAARSSLNTLMRELLTSTSFNSTDHHSDAASHRMRNQGGTTLNISSLFFLAARSAVCSKRRDMLSLPKGETRKKTTERNNTTRSMNRFAIPPKTTYPVFLLQMLVGPSLTSTLGLLHAKRQRRKEKAIMQPLIAKMASSGQHRRAASHTTISTQNVHSNSERALELELETALPSVVEALFSTVVDDDGGHDVSDMCKGDGRGNTFGVDDSTEERAAGDRKQAKLGNSQRGKKGTECDGTSSSMTCGLVIYYRLILLTIDCIFPPFDAVVNARLLIYKKQTAAADTSFQTTQSRSDSASSRSFNTMMTASNTKRSFAGDDTTDTLVCPRCGEPPSAANISGSILVPLQRAQHDFDVSSSSSHSHIREVSAHAEIPKVTLASLPQHTYDSPAAAMQPEVVPLPRLICIYRAMRSTQSRRLHGLRFVSSVFGGGGGGSDFDDTRDSPNENISQQSLTTMALKSTSTEQNRLNSTQMHHQYSQGANLLGIVGEVRDLRRDGFLSRRTRTEGAQLVTDHTAMGDCNGTEKESDVRNTKEGQKNQKNASVVRTELRRRTENEAAGTRKIQSQREKEDEALVSSVTLRQRKYCKVCGSQLITADLSQQAKKQHHQFPQHINVSNTTTRDRHHRNDGDRVIKIKNKHPVENNSPLVECSVIADIIREHTFHPSIQRVVAVHSQTYRSSLSSSSTEASCDAPQPNKPQPTTILSYLYPTVTTGTKTSKDQRIPPESSCQSSVAHQVLQDLSVRLERLALQYHDIYFFTPSSTSSTPSTQISTTSSTLINEHQNDDKNEKDSPLQRDVHKKRLKYIIADLLFLPQFAATVGLKVLFETWRESEKGIRLRPSHPSLPPALATLLPPALAHHLFRLHLQVSYFPPEDTR